VQQLLCITSKQHISSAAGSTKAQTNSGRSKNQRDQHSSGPARYEISPYHTSFAPSKTMNPFRYSKPSKCVVANVKQYVRERDGSTRFVLAQKIAKDEMAFLKSLRACAQFFVQPAIYQSKYPVDLKKRNKGKLPNIELSKSIALCFSRFLDMLAISIRFLKEFRQQLSSWTHGQTLGDVLAQFGPLSEIYKPYAKFCERAVQDLHSKEWKPWVRDVEKKTGVRVVDSLQLPMKRLGRHVLNLQQLLKVTPRFHPDFSKIDEAIHNITEAADFMAVNLESVNSKRDQIAPFLLEKTSPKD
jgi:hypothetical protein